MALLSVDTLNGEKAGSRSAVEFDQLTACYPARPLSLPGTDARISAIAGRFALCYGQRLLLRYDGDDARTDLLLHLAGSLHEGNPEASVSLLLVNVRPEDAALCSQAVDVPVYAASLDQSPDFSLRQADLLLEQSLRSVEAGKDVILLVDSLTDLGGLYPIAAQQPGQPSPGFPCPGSLQKAKRLFGAARATEQAGTLTILAAVKEKGLEVFQPMCNCYLHLTGEGGLAEDSFLRTAP